MASSGLSTSGKLFFSSLCASTFGLGCWQTRRYFEKIQCVEERKQILSQGCVELEKDAKCANDANKSFTPIVVRGKFRHEDEVLIGPRGPPMDSLSKTGPNSGRSQGGMASSPQGYYCLTPLERSDNAGVVVVNRGWIPRSYIQEKAVWHRPTTIVTVEGVSSTTEIPRFLSPPHDVKEPRKLLWFDRRAIEEKTQTVGKAPVLVTETSEHQDARGPPFKPSKQSAGEFKVASSTHAGYAVTWFGLSGAGIFMTRKLITRGR